MGGRLHVHQERRQVLGPAEFRDLVSGRRRGWAATLLRGALRIAEVGYTAAVRLRNCHYDRPSNVKKIGVPVISVGNLTLGGTGKTPMVRWIARFLRERGIHPAVVSRGYGSNADEENDESLELRWLLPDVPHFQDANRAAAAGKAIREVACQAIVLDDGFQHRRIARDLDIVLLDALEPFGFGHVFPRGALREPLDGLRRADLAILTRADLLGPPDRAQIWRRIRRHAPGLKGIEAAHVPTALLSAEGKETPLDELQGQSVAAFCGIGNPSGFRRTLERLGCRIAGFREFPDHHRYTADDLEALLSWAGRLNASSILCTCKDMVKLPAEKLHHKRVQAVKIDILFLDGQTVLESLLVEKC